MTDRPRRTPLYRNSLSYFGGLVVVGSTILIAVAMVLQTFERQAGPYVGILTYMLLPTFVGVGALLFLWGMRRESLRRRRMGAAEFAAYPALDLNDPRQRRRFAFALPAAFLVLVLLAVASYHAFIFTESVTFCGRLCHVVMEPEHTAYLASPHARVTCVQCHVGEGAEWYVKSKLSGVRQVFAVLLNNYRRPIEVPIRNLRPARETCEQCHWPQKFYGGQLIKQPHFRYDEANTAEEISLIVKTGGGNPKLGESAGIHWHMILENKVTYVASDEKLQVIPWFSVQRPDGSVEEYTSRDFKGGARDLAALEHHRMDCIDCHNRPTHIYAPPEGAIDQAMLVGRVSRRLPWIKKVAVDALVKSYPDNDAAHRGLRADIEGFYAAKYPASRTAMAGAIDEAVQAAIEIYDRSVFPKMNVNWTTYASNIGHRNWPGCFRCHDGRHVNTKGGVLTTDCASCHTMPQRGPLAPLGATVPHSDQNWHPWELKGRHSDVLCNRCHAAGYRPPTDCAECHRLDARAPMMTDCTACHQAPGVKLPLADCKGCHEKPPGDHRAGGHPDAACTDCHKPHGWKVASRDTCLACHDDMKAHYPDGGPCAACHQFKGTA